MSRTPARLDINTCDRDFITLVKKRSGQNPSLCIQCGKCTAGCPASGFYDFQVNAVMRLVQAGQAETVLRSHAIWLCALCQTCSVRCPMQIDVAEIMETLRAIAWERGLCNEKRVKRFHQAFLNSLRRNGRIHELGLMAEYALTTGHLTADVDLAPKALPKLSIKPHSIEGKEEIRRILERHQETKS